MLDMPIESGTILLSAKSHTSGYGDCCGTTIFGYEILTALPAFKAFQATLGAGSGSSVATSLAGTLRST